MPKKKTFAGHPAQPLEKDKDGHLRFKSNSIVKHLLEKGPVGLHELRIKNFPREDYVQFAQLIGYSLSAFEEVDPAIRRQRTRLPSSPKIPSAPDGDQSQ